MWRGGSISRCRHRKESFPIVELKVARRETMELRRRIEGSQWVVDRVINVRHARRILRRKEKLGELGTKKETLYDRSRLWMNDMQSPLGNFEHLRIGRNMNSIRTCMTCKDLRCVNDKGKSFIRPDSLVQFRVTSPYVTRIPHV